jgi:propionate CoA-transferase
MVAYLSKTYYARTARYATSTLTRQKLQDALRRRGLQTRVFESAKDAAASLEEATAAE